MTQSPAATRLIAALKRRTSKSHRTSAPRPLSSLCVGLVAALTLTACGPITAHQAIRKATISVEAARAAQADRYAVYELVSAVEFLKKAREMEGYSNFQDAADLALIAAEYGDKAKTRAINNPTRGLNGLSAPAPAGDAADEGGSELPEDAAPEGSSL